MGSIETQVNNYLNNKLLSIKDLPTCSNGSFIDRLCSKKFTKYCIAPEIKQSVGTKLDNIIKKEENLMENH